MKTVVKILLLLLLAAPTYGAEFLIYDKDHWMDLLTAQQVTQMVKDKTITQDEYDARYQRGDIVAVKPDGHFTSTLKGDLSKWSFRVVVVEGLPADQAYTDSTATKKRRYNIQDGALKTIHIVSNIQDITVTDKTSITLKHDQKQDILLIDILLIARMLMLFNLS